jgi:tetratricopeptide (TPR) repeat protein
MISSNNIYKRSALKIHRDVLVCLFLVIATVAVYWQVSNHEFVNFDDDRYVTENTHVQAGLSRESVIWAFTATDVANWHPLTWLSHMLDYQLYGMNTKGHHLTNVFFHLANTIFLFLVLKWMTGALWRSAFVAALFALHPLHVESVAWVAERKDVLSTFFWILTIWTYLRYVERPAFHRYLLILFSLALGLMAKPMLVTLPFVLLLLDYWPLYRFQLSQPGSAHPIKKQASLCATKLRAEYFRLLWEKIPLFALAAISSIVTFLVQRSGGAVGDWEIYPAKIRIANALVSYVSYIGKMIWPHNLAIFYPHPGQNLQLWQAAGAGLLIGLITMAVLRLARSHPYLIVGWLWYLGTLMPVIGLVQTGTQGMADRYTYVPLIGLFIMIAWGFSELGAKWRYQRIGLALAASVILAASMILTWTQLHHWKSTFKLFEHARNVTVDNYLAHNNLGIAYARQGNIETAIDHYTKAVQIKPNLPRSHNNLGNAYARQGRMNEAIAHYTLALQIKPDFAGAHNNLGNVLAGQGKNEEAIFHFARAQQLQPDFAEASFNMGSVLARQGSMDEALAQFTRALELKPDFAEAHNSMGVILARTGNLDDAIVHFHEALKLKPTFIQAHNNLRIALQQAGHQNESSQNGPKPLN